MNSYQDIFFKYKKFQLNKTDPMKKPPFSLTELGGKQLREPVKIPNSNIKTRKYD
jgi:hypothetical protein